MNRNSSGIFELFLDPEYESLPCPDFMQESLFTRNKFSMADDDLEQIRARRMAELQSRGMGQEGGPSRDEQEKKAQHIADMKNSILSQVLDQSARGRLNTLAVAKPEKAQMVENMLIQMAQSGQITNRLGEEELRVLLERVSEKTQKKTTVKYRRQRLDDSDED
ncbi:hypothetical protein ScPMuIL_000570 [Solemya velum]